MLCFFFFALLYYYYCCLSLSCTITPQPVHTHTNTLTHSSLFRARTSTLSFCSFKLLAFNYLNEWNWTELNSFYKKNVKSDLNQLCEFFTEFFLHSNFVSVSIVMIGARRSTIICKSNLYHESNQIESNNMSWHSKSNSKLKNSNYQWRNFLFSSSFLLLLAIDKGKKRPYGNDVCICVCVWCFERYIIHRHRQMLFVLLRLVALRDRDDKHR